MFSQAVGDDTFLRLVYDSELEDLRNEETGSIIDEEDKKQNDPNYCWRFLRIMLCESTEIATICKQGPGVHPLKRALDHFMGRANKEESGTAGLSISLHSQTKLLVDNAQTDVGNEDNEIEIDPCVSVDSSSVKQDSAIDQTSMHVGSKRKRSE
jgi:hypothetical protein